jgi:hypothetical protein
MTSSRRLSVPLSSGAGDSCAVDGWGVWETDMLKSRPGPLIQTGLSAARILP